MADDIPFNKSFDLAPGQVDEAMPGMRRVLCNNPSPFTFKGTVSYIIGRGQVAIIDPGPDDAAHIAALLDAVRGETVTHIFVTHTHRDHSPAVPAIKAATGAQALGEGSHRAARALHVGEAPRLDASNDTAFRPDRALADGARIDVRSASRYGRHDFGANASRIRSLLEDIDDAVSVRTGDDERRERKAPTKQAQPKPKTQPVRR